MGVGIRGSARSRWDATNVSLILFPNWRLSSLPSLFVLRFCWCYLLRFCLWSLLVGRLGSQHIAIIQQWHPRNCVSLLPFLALSTVGASCQWRQRAPPHEAFTFVSCRVRCATLPRCCDCASRDVPSSSQLQQILASPSHSLGRRCLATSLARLLAEHSGGRVDFVSQRFVSVLAVWGAARHLSIVWLLFLCCVNSLSWWRCCCW